MADAGDGNGMAFRTTIRAHPEEWLLIEWPQKEAEPTQYRLSTLPEKTPLKSLVKMAKHRWIVERDSEEFKHLYRSLWVAGRRAEPFFPLSARRTCWIIRPGAAKELPPKRVAALVPSGITHPLLPPCD